MDRTYLALDIGGTKVAAGLVSADGEVLVERREATAVLRAGGDPLGELLRLSRGLLHAAGKIRPAGVGLGLPGPVDRAGIRMLAAPTIPEIWEVPLEPVFGEAFGCPVAGDNDANACALAESRFGAGAGCGHVVYVTVSTGIGGGFVVDGRVFRGASGTSAEFGHQVILPQGGPRCDCGSHGCLEALASGRGIAARARAARGTPGEAPSAESVAEAARRGETWARAVWEDTALYLGLGLSNLINVLDPEIIVLGGGVGVGAADLLLEPVRDVVRRRCMPSLARSVRIVPAALGSTVGLVGAACLAMDSSEDRPAA